MTQQEMDRYNALSEMNQQLIQEIQDLLDTVTEKHHAAKRLQQTLTANIAEMRYLSLSCLEGTNEDASLLKPIFKHPILRLKLWGNDGGV